MHMQIAISMTFVQKQTPSWGGHATTTTHPHLGVIDERSEHGWGHRFKSGADYSQVAGPWSRTGIRGMPRGSFKLRAHANEGVTSLVLFSLKEGCAHLLRYQIAIAQAWSSLHTYTSAVRRSCVGSPRRWCPLVRSCVIVSGIDGTG